MPFDLEVDKSVGLRGVYFEQQPVGMEIVPIPFADEVGCSRQVGNTEVTGLAVKLHDDHRVTGRDGRRVVIDVVPNSLTVTHGHIVYGRQEVQNINYGYLGATWRAGVLGLIFAAAEDSRGGDEESDK